MKLTVQRNREAGFNLIEAAIVLGIVGLVVGGIWAAASSAYENMRQQSAAKQILALVQGIKNYYANSGAGAIAGEANLVNFGIVPKDMVAGTQIVSPLSTAATTAAQVTTSTALPVVLTITAVRQNTCRSFFARQGLSIINAVTSVTVGGTAVTGTNLSNVACTADASGVGTNDIAITFGLN